MACADPRLTALKIGYKGEIHRLRVDLSQCSFNELQKLFLETFQLEADTYVIQFFDVKGQRLVVSNEEAFLNACQLYLQDDEQNTKSLRFMAQSKHSAALYEATEPILKAIEKLLEQLNQVMQKVILKAKEDDWEGKCRRGLNTTSDALQKVASDARDSFAECKKQVQEYPYDELIQEATDGMKLAAQEIKNFAQEFAQQMQEHVAAEYATAEVATETTDIPQEASKQEETPKQEVAEVPEPVADQTEDALEDSVIISPDETDSAEEIQSTSDDEWDVVPTPVENERKEKWAAQLKMVREIFPDCNLPNALELLERSHGNIHVVLNALAEN